MLNPMSIRYPADLPITAKREEIMGAIRDRSKEVARRTRECAKAILRRYAKDDTAPGEPIGAGGEHELWHSENGSHVSKFTINDQFGYVMDQQNGNRGHKPHLRPALPSEYLLRLGTQKTASFSTN